MGRPPLPRDVARQMITARLPAALVARLDEAAKQYEISRTQVVETALRALLDGGQADARRADEIRGEVVAQVRRAIDAALNEGGS